MLWLASQTPNFLRFLPLGDLLGIRVRKHYSRCRIIWAKIIIFYCLTVLGQEDLVRHYFPILSIKLSWQVNTVRDLSSKVFHRCRNKLFKIIFVHYFVHWRTELLKRKKSQKDGVRFLVPFAGEVCSMKNFPSKLNGCNIYINAAVARSGNNFVAWFWWLKRATFTSQDGFIESFER